MLPSSLSALAFSGVWVWPLLRTSGRKILGIRQATSGTCNIRTGGLRFETVRLRINGLGRGDGKTTGAIYDWQSHNHS
jgi:hypothetical protein